MALASGARFGPYEVVASLGAGGMGEVYRARDAKLGRDVALKVLPAAFADDAERLARFDREAKALAALNHPNIAHIYGFEHGETNALVMELVEGEDLARRLARGPIPLDEALPIAKQIVDALEAAHDHGIIHRDLKPANIIVREDGTVKVLDFGLAKALDPVSAAGTGPASPLVDSPTITTPAMTARGVILGTAAYMSPEQAKGKAVDKRADIWAFGCVLYEMVSGRRAFAGDDVSDTFASVLRGEVDWSGVPPPIVRLLKKCLEKDPKRRLHDIADAWTLIDEPRVETAPTPARGAWLPWAVAAVLLATTVGLAVVHFRESPVVAEPVRFQIQPPAKNTFDIYLVLSPNGRRLAFTARDDAGVVHLWVRDLDALEARQLPETAGAWSPFWSPDGRHLAFAADRLLKRIDVSGGLPQTLAELPSIVGMGAWSRDGVIVFGSRGPGPLRRIPASGGTPTDLTVVDAARAESFHGFPLFLPDAKHFLYYRQSSAPEFQGIYVGSLDDSADGQSLARLLPAAIGPVQGSFTGTTSRLLFLKDGTLMTQSFDPERRSLIGEATPFTERVGSSGSFGYFSASSDVLVYRTGVASATSLEQLTWLDRKGTLLSTVGEPRQVSGAGASLALAPDARSAVAAVAPPPSSTSDLWLVEFARGIFTRLTFRSTGELTPVWSPDGTRVAFRMDEAGVGNLYVKPTNGTSEETLLLRTPQTKIPVDWSGDGRFLFFITLTFSGADLWVLPLETGTPMPILQTPFNEVGARLSPDGKWLAYGSNESGRSEVYLRPFLVSADGTPTLGSRWQVSADGGASPRWRRDGKELFFRTASGPLMAVNVAVVDGAVRTDTPRQLFTLPQNALNWDVASDGQRFLISMPVSRPSSDPISVVLNWRSVR
jgi:eukaryotic-like serine/threonine-protein kinase